MNEKHLSTPIGRRAFWRQSAAVALGAGLLPGQPRAENVAEADFEFLAFNDPHFQDLEHCPAWFEKIFAAMRASAPRAAFALLSGDLTQNASAAEFEGLKKLFPLLKVPVLVTPGNHDVNAAGLDNYAQAFPGTLNYATEQCGWQVIGLDSTDGEAYEKTRIKPETLAWLDAYLPQLDARKPTILFTHFPLGAGLQYRPAKAGDVLKRLAKFNLQAVFCGHFHGYSETLFNNADLTTGRCCSRIRSNHDASPLKGWFVCSAQKGRIARRFVAAPAELLATARA